MKIIIPLAGRGSRFKELGYKMPKPLIEIKGKPMVKWAVECVNFADPKDLIFICRQDHIKDQQLDQKLRELFSDKISIIEAEKIPEGAACSVLLAKDLINTNEDLIICNADQYFKSNIGEEIKNKAADITGIVPYFKATHPKWSYLKIDNNNFITETAEKIPISMHATVGLYYFAKGKDFVWAAEEMIKKDLRRFNEFFVCPVYNELIKRGDKILAIPVEQMWGLGTPEDIEYFEKYCK